MPKNELPLLAPRDGITRSHCRLVNLGLHPIYSGLHAVLRRLPNGDMSSMIQKRFLAPEAVGMEMVFPGEGGLISAGTIPRITLTRGP